MWDLIVSVPDHCLSFYFAGRVSLFLVSLVKLPLLCRQDQQHLDCWRHRYKLGQLDDVWLSRISPIEYGLRREVPSIMERLQLDRGSTSF